MNRKLRRSIRNYSRGLLTYFQTGTNFISSNTHQGSCCRWVSISERRTFHRGPAQALETCPACVGEKDCDCRKRKRVCELARIHKRPSGKYKRSNVQRNMQDNWRSFGVESRPASSMWTAASRKAFSFQARTSQTLCLEYKLIAIIRVHPHIPPRMLMPRQYYAIGFALV